MKRANSISKAAVFAWIGFIYSTVTGFLIVSWNRELGYPLPEVVDQGRWRGVYADFAGGCWLFGTIVYPTALATALYFAWQAWTRKMPWEKAVSLLLSALMIVIIAKFAQMRLEPGFLQSKAF